jgi:hypothetical protein
MRRIILALAGAALIIGSTNQVAFSKEHRHVHNVQRCSCERFRNAKAYAVPYYVPDVGSAYTGAAGAWASMTGFN